MLCLPSQFAGWLNENVLIANSTSLCWLQASSSSIYLPLPFFKPIRIIFKPTIWACQQFTMHLLHAQRGGGVGGGFITCIQAIKTTSSIFVLHQLDLWCSILMVKPTGTHRFCPPPLEQSARSPELQFLSCPPHLTNWQSIETNKKLSIA